MYRLSGRLLGRGEVIYKTEHHRMISDRLIRHWQPPAVLQVLVFDFGGEVYVWNGKDVSLGDRKVAVKLGKQLYSGSYDYSNCRVNPLDASCTNKEVPL